MTTLTDPVDGRPRRWRSVIATAPAGNGEPADEPPIRAELFSVAQLARHAATIAGWHDVGAAAGRASDRLLTRLVDNEVVLRDAYALISDAVRRGRQITPAAEWFIDNYPLIEEQIRTTRRHLPRAYGRELPRLINASLPGMPRVYDIALELISHAHGRVDGEGLGAFIAAYQTVQPLRLGELWAIPIMLRLALLENLRRVMSAVTAGRRDRELATYWVEQMTEVAASDPARVVLVLADMVEAAPALTDPFVAELASRLRGQSAALAFPMAWLEQRLAEQGQTVDQVFQQASQSQAADQVAISNSIGSLRFVTANDWRVFVESMSVVERTLRDDPTGDYGAMDFATRDRYRHVVEDIARRSPRSEDEIASLAVELAAADRDRPVHVGRFLIGAGRRALELAAGMHQPPRLWLRRRLEHARHAIYGGSIVALTAAATVLLAYLLPLGRGDWLEVGWWAVLVVATSQLAVALVHWAATMLVPPKTLPRLDFTAGIPVEHRTLVAVPTMLTDVAAVDEMVEALEVRFLANRDGNLGLALVTDLRDAATETVEGDEGLVQRARDGITALNARYPDSGGFFLFHRQRRWNPRERLWMGWERKRGKLEELNEALRGELGRFATVVGPIERLAGVRYVIALDADTSLPRESARILAATLAHPLNRPQLDVARGRVTAGYGILQPRVSVSMASIACSRFARLFGGEPGIDPYTRAVSDVYQDLFDEGSFIGKGIYDVDAVRGALGGRLPDNRVLSHDLLEGAYARAGLVSDVLLVEDYPATHGADVSRRHRWTRGDWQIASWLRRRVPTSTRRIANPISVLSQWKILDNLRRSLVPIALVILLLVGWMLPGAALAASLAVATILVLPGILAAAAALARRPVDHPRDLHAREIARTVAHQLGREGFALAILPFEAWMSLDAIARTTGRVLVTRRRLLQWRTSADSHRAARLGLLGSFASMWVGPLLVAVVAVVLVRLAQEALVPAAPVLALWAIAPGLAWWLSRPLVPVRPTLTWDERTFLHAIARRTWRFFETYVGPEDNYLPPDNVQEDPPRGAAHRTSPTNIGLSLTANLAAYDFGYLTAGEVIARTTRTLASLDRMERYRGHFYNWYDTTTLEPLRPTYVSTVDSGNLAGHLATLAAGLDELVHAPAVARQVFTGLATTLDLVAEGASSWPDATRLVTRLRTELQAEAPTPAEYGERLDRLIADAGELVRVIDARGAPEPSGWAQAFASRCRAARDERAWLTPADPDLAVERAEQRAVELRALAARCRALADVDYDFLYDSSRHLLSIGYNVGDHHLDAGSYDLLASEARLASFIAIAQGKLPQEHWFSLGRVLTTTSGQPALLSWSGSMFEYLMPLLVMPTYDGTLLDETYRAVVDRQIAYGRERGVPWGVSESAYNKVDAHLDYQYRAFGVPGLGFKRGLADDLVISPYSTAMALMVEPRAATANLNRLARDGMLGGHGFYEAIDYTATRLPTDKPGVVVRSYMAHHQGMAFLSLAYLLLDRPMQRRFAADPGFQATELLLQERVPRSRPIDPHPAEVSTTSTGADPAEHDLRVYTTPDTPWPEVHLLSNGSYHVAITNAGGGYSRWRDLAVTRWREDATRDCWGTFGYLRDVDTGAFWSVAHQPTLVAAQHYEAIYSQGRAEFRRSDGDLDTHVEISVSPEDDIELRRVTITNRSRTRRTLELTSFAEVVLTQSAADASHPSFSNLFVQTELVRAQQAILATRRPRSGGDRPPWMIHLLTVDGTAAGPISYETSRAAFLGRCRSVADPIAMYRDALTDSEGSVLDPIVAIRGRVVLEPDAVARLHIATGVAETRDSALRLVDKYRDRHAADRVFELSWTHSQVVQRRLDASNLDTQRYDRLASRVLYTSSALRAPSSLIARNRSGQAGLWAYSISGDLPIVLVRIGDVAHLDLVRQLVKAHAYWRLKGLVADLVIWNEDPSGYRQTVQDEIIAIVAALTDGSLLDKPGGIFVRRSEQISEEDKVLMQTVARLIVSDAGGTLAEHLDRWPRAEPPVPLLRGHERRVAPPLQLRPAPPAAADRPDLVGFNGHGGFTRDGREYVITTARDRRTPAPWVNVLANPWFGTVVSESGGAYTWCENAHSYRLTPWHNDAVTDASGEALYLRDEDDGRYWSPTPLPAGGAGWYASRHGFGYSIFEASESGIASELTTFVATDAPVKFLIVKLRNQSGRPRRISLTAFFELVLGANRGLQLPHVVTELDRHSHGLLAYNAYNTEFAARVAFLDCSEDQRTVTGDRRAFLGRNGDPARPASMARARLSGLVGAGLDPCLAMQATVELADGQEREVAFAFGSGRDLGDACHLVRRFHGTAPARAALEGVWDHWKRTLGAVQVQTPDPALDFLANGWLLYQVLASRMWGRSGFYQSGGAYGFRDQLQDAMALIHAEPRLLREQIVRSAARQFPQGDVQHWWHPPQGRGVRTHISDDYLWLPYATCRYVAAIGDTGVLDEEVRFIEGRPVKDDEDSYYDLPAPSEDSATVYQHCVRAIRNGLRFGVHELPLMGSGDWNDGMNLVGEHGRGESVWLAFFLHDVLARFSELARRRGDGGFADTCASEAARLRVAIETHGWDGDWYRRAYFDDGTPLGSASSPECQIDALPQSWAVLSGAGDPERARIALAAVDLRLVRRDLGVVQLFDPPFDTSDLKPGYIKGYVPGVRENGGQYTHAAVWVAMAFAAAGDRERAWELFDLINPVRHGDSARAIATYQVEPYVVAADVYTNPQHAGRGGWTWYTGSAGWMYRLIIESLLGLRLEVDRLRVEPLVPAGWTGFDVHYRHRETHYHIHVHPRRGVSRVICDGVEQPDRTIPLRDDRRHHDVVVELV